MHLVSQAVWLARLRRIIVDKSHHHVLFTNGMCQCHECVYQITSNTVSRSLYKLVGFIEAYQTVFRTTIAPKRRVRQRRIGQSKKWVVTRMFVPHTHAGGGVACGARESLPVAGRGRGFSLQLAALGFPPSCLTATTLLAARLAPKFRVGSTGWPSTI